MTDTTAEKRIHWLDAICARLEDSILAGRGDVKAMRREWRECQNEMRRLEGAEDA